MEVFVGPSSGRASEAETVSQSSVPVLVLVGLPRPARATSTYIMTLQDNT